MNMIKRLALVMLAIASIQGIAQAADQEIRYYHNDATGSPVASTDETGTVVWQTKYKPFGSKVQTSLNEASNRIGFTGHVDDKNTGLTYMQQRYYDADLGRFYANDPVGYVSQNPIQSFNRYAYGNNNPYKFVDPDGEFLDTVLDVGFVIYDVGALIYDEVANDGQNRTTNLLALGADVGAVFVPFATGAGLAVRGAKTIKKGCGCFVAGTQVKVKIDGVASYKNIEDINVGDLVWSKDENATIFDEDGEPTLAEGWKAVTETFVFNDRNVIQVTLSFNGKTQLIETTADHPFYVAELGSWVATNDLVAGRHMVDDNNQLWLIEDIAVTPEVVETYNLSVQDYATYFVTENDVWVHNVGPCKLALGLADGLEDFAKLKGGKTYTELGGSWNDSYEVFQKNILKQMDSVGSIQFNLNGFDVMKFKRYLQSSDVGKASGGNATNFELYTILTNNSYLNKTEFSNGSISLIKEMVDAYK